MKPESLRMRVWRDKNKKPCPDCGTLIYPDSSFCIKCSRKQYSLAIGDTTTIGELREKAIETKGHPSWAYGNVRINARYRYNRNSTSPCENCGYDKHTEVCHIKPISEWSDDIFVSAINSPENILILCRNCHWEFDNCVISLEQIKNAAVAQ